LIFIPTVLSKAYPDANTGQPSDDVDSDVSSDHPFAVPSTASRTSLPLAAPAQEVPVLDDAEYDHHKALEGQFYGVFSELESGEGVDLVGMAAQIREALDFSIE
jgi:hypothetical protein